MNVDEKILNDIVKNLDYLTNDLNALMNAFINGKIGKGSKKSDLSDKNKSDNGDDFDNRKIFSHRGTAESDLIMGASIDRPVKKKLLKEEESSKLKELEEAKKKLEEASKAYEEAKAKGLTGKDLEPFKNSLEECLENVNDIEDEVVDIKEKLKDTTIASSVMSAVGKFNEGLKNTTNIVSSIFDGIKSLMKPWAEADKAASKYAKTIGMTKAGMDSLRKSTINNVAHSKIAAEFNVSIPELLEVQANYAQNIGRNVSVSDAQQRDLAAMHSVMGGKESELIEAFDNFGVNLSGVAEHAGEMFNQASKNGLSFQKYSENVAKNIKIAQNYTFKNGLKGLESMAKKATAMKMDMSQVASLADKVSTVEGSIDVASKLQVLGGPFASFADPLGMMTEGLTDMEGLFDRVVKMIGDLGTYDKQSGQVKLSAFNQQRIKAAAQAMGMDYTTLTDSANAQARRNEIEKQLNTTPSARGLNEDMIELIKNTATIGKNGKAVVSIGGEEKEISNLTNADYQPLIKATQDENKDIKDIAQILLSWDESIEGGKKQKDALQAQLTENTGIGEGVKNITKLITHSNLILGIIAGVQAAGTVANVVSSVRLGRMGAGTLPGGGSVGGGLGSRLGGLFGKGGAKAVGAATSVGPAANMIGGAAGTAPNIIGGTVENSAKNVISKAIGNETTKVISEAGEQAVKKGFTTRVTETVGTKALSTVGKVGDAGAKMAGKGGVVGKVGEGLFNSAAKTEGKLLAKAGIKSTTKMATEEVGKKVGGALLKGGAKGVGVGLALGLAGEGMGMWKDNLLAKGKIKEGNFAHGAMTVSENALKGAAWGSMLGVPGMIAGAAIGSIVGGVKMAKLNRGKALDNKLAEMGIEKKGEYGAWGLKRINNALDDGKISRRLRRKLERQGDTAILAQIDAKKKEKDEEREAKKDRRAERWGKIFGGGNSSISKGVINVDTAYINSKKLYEKEFNDEEFGNDKESGIGDKVKNILLAPAKLASKAINKLFGGNDENKDKTSKDEIRGKLKGLGIGAAIGTLIAPGIGTAIGGAIGLISAKKKQKNEKIVDTQLEKLGIDRRGNYGSRSLGLIDKALQTGELSDRMRKKLLENGDTELLDAINKKKTRNETENNKENEIKEKVLSIANATISIGNADINQNNKNGRLLYNNIGLNAVEEIKGRYNKRFNILNTYKNTGSDLLLPLTFGFKAGNYIGKKLNINKGIQNIKPKPEDGSSPLLEKFRNVIKREKEGNNGELMSQNRNVGNYGGLNDKIDINISGTIKLVGSNGTEVDITDKLLKGNNGYFIRELTKRISTQLQEFKFISNRQDNNVMFRS